MPRSFPRRNPKRTPRAVARLPRVDAAVDGRRLRLTSGYVSVFGSTLTNSSGGAIEVHGGSLVVVQSAFWHNTASFGGAVRVSGGHVELNHCHFEGNRATGLGGAMARSWPLSNP